MRRSDHSRLLAGIALVAAAIALPMAAGQTAAGASGRNPNAMMPVQPGMSAASLPHAAVFGVTPPGTPETVSFVLREQNLFQLEAAVEQGVTNYLSVSQFAQTYGQSQDNISQLQDYLAKFGITTQVDADDVDVVANGTAGEFDAALVVQQHQYYVPEVPGRDGMRPVPPQWVHGTRQLPELPYRLSRFILAILGLTNYGPFDTQMVHADSALSPAGAGSSDACVALTGLPDGCNTPASFASNYGLDPLYGQGATGAGQTIAIVTLAALDEGAPEYFWQNVLGLPASTRTVTVVNVDGGPGAPSDAAGTGETDLDVEQSGGLAPDAQRDRLPGTQHRLRLRRCVLPGGEPEHRQHRLGELAGVRDLAVEAAIASGSGDVRLRDGVRRGVPGDGRAGPVRVPRLAGDWGAYDGKRRRY